MSKQLSILLDTNVWLDYFLGSRNGHAMACSLVNLAFEKNQTLTYSLSSVKDVYYIMGLKLKKAAREEKGCLSDSAAAAANAAAWGCINNMQEIACAIPIDLPDVWMASKQRVIHADFEDDLLIAAAKRAQVDYLVTNDERLLRHCPVASLDVADMCAQLQVLGE